ncbi:transcriptional regulator [Dissulfurispira thermophila]|uniref:Transcriptional regulator n=1 Tax=Dissulfurispira thermophila TaxID=2715679 RepID=A0A7G1H106_9BACT|nr:Crp/Fnr family transcriptional regulator [Dissulfurispira thermophila]BCB96490.1 transcriptional regulator [Dissulfurispira thermophila]
MIDDTFKNLKVIPIFSSLDDEELKEVQPYLIRDNFKKKQEIFSEGDPSDWFYILISGKVKITKMSIDGREIIIELISPPDFFGGFAVLKGFPYPANAVAMEDSNVIKISRHNLLKIIDRFPNVMYEMTANLGDRIREFHDTLKNIALERVESRIAALLLKLADKTGERKDNSILINMRLTKQDIAEMVGTTVETAIRIMSKFKKSGFIDDKDGKILIKDIGALELIVYP